MLTIEKAKKEDLEKILQLQYSAYQSEAKLFNNPDIPPLKQTLDDVTDEFNKGIILKATDESNTITGSVRAYKEKGSVYISKLMVHPDSQRKGIGTKLLSEIENEFPSYRYELYTSTKSTDNIKLYERLGYRIFKTEQISQELHFVYLEKITKGANMVYIRPATISDVSRIAEIIITNYRTNFYPFFKNDAFYFGELNVLDMVDEYKEGSENLKNSFVYDDNAVKGVIRISGTEIEKLFIEPTFQSQGIGAKLLDFAINHHNADRLWVLEYNKRGIEFYKRHGFQLTGEKIIEDEWVPLLKMELAKEQSKMKGYIDLSKITACGECCNDCKKKADGICKGCIEADGYVPEWAESGRCKVHTCTRNHGVRFCGLCEKFPCDDIAKIVHWNPDIVKTQAMLRDKFKKRQGE